MTKKSSLLMGTRDTEARYSRMDELLLNLASSVGILFSLVQAAIAGVNSIVLFSPLLLLGWGLPIYVGYIRGAIRNSRQERVRGWIYLVVGVLIYCAHVGFDLLHVSGTSGELDLFSVLFPAVVVFLEAMFVVAYGQLLTGWILDVPRQEVEPDILMISRSTQCSAFFLSLGLEYVVRQYVSQPSSGASIWIYLIAIIMIFWGLISFKVSESWSVISKNAGVLFAETRKLRWAYRAGGILVLMIAGGASLALGIGLSQWNGLLSSLLIGIAFLLLLSPGVIGWLSPPFMARFDSARLKELSEPNRQEINTALSWIKAIERIQKSFHFGRLP